ncbi:uncharacterized protein [Neodiprion pinetum]|uniref:Uncharacterized protein LOC107222155 n=1 Tax=Neodiprion lecontei TaxID=441921 RepID=A0A6J0BSI5_NEOLC|nr:uncharacterized protein LOC107222155 [Neodiprion lecontei]XP_046470197.1 uncharacterized protein LOC124213199 [Neodiprion pinetum]
MTKTCAMLTKGVYGDSEKDEKALEIIQEAFIALNANYMRRGARLIDLRERSIIATVEVGKKKCNNIIPQLKYSKKLFTAAFFTLLSYCLLSENLSANFALKYALGTRCLVPNNYFVWEFTRPVSTCEFCRGIDSALILPNLTREEFKRYAYSSRPMVIKNAAGHWPAKKVFSLYFFRNLYESIEGAYESVQEECQFLHFKSNFASLKEVFAMSDRRALNLPGEQPWYVGWKNCHPQVLEIMKEFYQTPHFLPQDAEVPHTNYVFLGYEQGAVMHLDYIPRLMWQGQVLGSKTWSVAPTPECDKVCKKFDFSVNAGDIILLDTRVWYHGTNVKDGQFSLTVTSEYG